MDRQLLQPVCATNPIVFLDITIGKEFAGRMIIELRKDVVPKTAENFRCLCTGERGVGQLGQPLHYKGVRFHKVTRVFAAQGGDIVKNDGTSGESIYGPVFEDENFELPHEEGVISMANYGNFDTNNSQFVITSVACDNLNGLHVVVGRVLRGLGVVGEMEQNTTDESQPTQDIIITDCGEILPGQKWEFADNDETDDNLPPYPQDWEKSPSELTLDEKLYILTIIRCSGNHFFMQERYYDARRKYRKANRYYLMLRKHYEWQELQPNNDIDCEELERLDAFSVINNVNIAAVELKLEEYIKANYMCTEAIRLDNSYSKAYYRRGQAQIGLTNYEEAIKDLKRAHELMPLNKHILNELNRAKKLLSDYNRMQMNALKKLFK